MNYITFNEMIEVNGLLEEKGLNFKVHLRDALRQRQFCLMIRRCGSLISLQNVISENLKIKITKNFPVIRDIRHG